MSNSFNICNECNIPKVLVPGKKRPDGTSYDSFMGCPNYKNHKPKINAQRPQQGGRDGVTILADEVADFRKEFNERMDAMAKFLAEKLGTKKEVNVKDIPFSDKTFHE